MITKCKKISLVRIPFSRATELAEKFKILDVLYPLFVEEPSVYLCNPIGNGQSVNGEVIPSVTNKCNMVSSPLPPFNNNNSHRTQQEEYSPSIPNWDSRPSYLNSHYDHHHRKFFFCLVCLFIHTQLSFF